MWPNGQAAAVSITYDDGHPSNLDIGVADLEYFGFRGTFFLSPGIPWVPPRAVDWRSASERGHEIANHSFSHPCPPHWDAPRSSDLPVTTMREFTEERFASEETGRAEQWLNDHVMKDDLRTYAYICDEERLGEGTEAAAKDRYLNLVRKTFYAARLGHGGPVSVDEVRSEPHRIPALNHTYGYGSPDKAIEYCESATRINGWAVLIFHYLVEGVPAKETETNRSVHREVLRHLSANRHRFWVAPFRDVYTHIIEAE